MKNNAICILKTVLTVMLSVLVAGCGASGSNSRQSGSAGSIIQGTGGVVAKLAWDTGSKAPFTASSAPAGVVTVRVIISAPDIVQGMQKDFPATLGSGVIDGVPAGMARTVTAQGLDGSGSVTYLGAAANITVQAGQTTDAGTIVMSASLTATDMPLTARSHMDAATQAVYDRIRANRNWLLGVDALGSAANAFVTVPTSQVQARWAELYGAAAGLPASIEWEMAERNRASVQRDWAGLTAFADAGGLPWIMISMNNFTVPFGSGTPPSGGMNDTSNHAAGVLPGGSGNAAFTAYIRQLAREIRAVGKPVIFRPFHEGNGGWFWWGGNEADFRALWAYAFQLFQEEQVTNVIWLWAASDICSGTACNAAAFYPGDAMVDMLGVDLYFNGSALPDRAGRTLRILESIGLDKPIVIAELGPAARADFWSQAVDIFAGIKRFRGFSLWFARGWNAWGGEPLAGSLIDESSDAATRAAFMSFLADPRVLMLSEWSGK